MENVIRKLTFTHSNIQGDTEQACKNYTGHRGCFTEQFEVGNLGSMKLA